MATAVTIANPGENYQVGDVLTMSGGTISSFIGPPTWPTNEVLLVVASVNESGGITAVTLPNPGSYKTPPSNPVSVTGGHGTGATFDLTWTGQTENLGVCFKYGYKNVQGARQWHGQPGYFFNYNPEVYGCNDTEWGTDCGDPTIYDLYSLNASQTKYLTLTYSIDYSEQVYECDGTEFANNNSSQSGTISVNAHSGVITVSDYSPPEDYCTEDGGASGVYVPMLTWNVQEWVDNFFRPLIYLSSSCYGNAESEVSCSSSGWTDDNFGGGCFYPGTEGTVGSIGASWSSTADEAGNITGFGASLSGASSADTSWSETLSMSDSSLTFSISNTVNTCPSGQKTVTNVTLSVSLSNPNTASDVLADVYSLMDEWDMTDDAQYPWRTDSNTSIAPLVARNEVTTGNVMPSTALPPFVAVNDGEGNTPCSAGWTPTFVAYTDPNAALYDGSVIGAPLPAGYQQAFDFYYTDYQSCNDGSGTVGYTNGWGQSNEGQNGIPLTATHWTPNNLAWQFPGGAWVFYNTNTSAGAFPGTAMVVAQKWAETKMGFPSQNFARPGGDDRFAYDETQVYTIQTISTTPAGPGTVIQLADCETCVTGTGDPLINPSGLWGGPSVGGFYEITGTNPVTLGALVYNVPSNWQSESCVTDGVCDTNYTFGKLRWSSGNPMTDPPAILGRAGVVSVTPHGANALLNTSALPNLGLCQTAGEYDLVDICDGTMTVISSAIQITRPPAWAMGINYTAGQYVTYNNVVYLALVNNVGEEPDTSPTYWQSIGSGDQYFVVPVAAATIANAAWIVSHGAPAYYWDDAFPKGDYVYTSWFYWNRLIEEANRWNTIASGGCDPTGCECPSGTETVYCFPFYDAAGGGFSSAFTQTEGCVPFTNCAPSVLCISPNGENFAIGTTWPFPGASEILLDEEWGSGWYAEFQQVMVDLLYQTPHYPASPESECSPAPFAWDMDNGACTADTGTIHYYPYAPLVEARITVPAGAPALPGGITLGWTTPAGIVNPSPPTPCSIGTDNATDGNDSGEILTPPGPNGYGLAQGGTVWSLWSVECSCIDGEGRFETVYEEQVVGCT